MKKDALMTFEEPTRTGYKFDAYYVNGAKIGSTWNYTEDKTLVASWSAINYKVKFNANGADNSVTMDVQEFTYDKADKLTKNAFTKAGYTFDGWTYKEATYADEAEVKNLTTTDKDEITMVAKWKAKTFTSNYNGNGHDGRQNMQPTTGEYGKDVQLRANAFTYKDHIFEGWAKSADGEVAYVTKGDANNTADTNVVYRNQIRGIVKVKIPFIAYPTVWLSETFSK